MLQTKYQWLSNASGKLRLDMTGSMDSSIEGLENATISIKLNQVSFFQSFVY